MRVYLAVDSKAATRAEDKRLLAKAHKQEAHKEQLVTSGAMTKKVIKDGKTTRIVYEEVIDA